VSGQTVAAPELSSSDALRLSVSSPSRQADIRFELPRAARATIRVFDVVGREVARPLDEPRAAGSHAVTWNPRVSSGVYFVRLDAGSGSAVRKFVRIR
jgi:hypothetical protein